MRIPFTNIEIGIDFGARAKTPIRPSEYKFPIVETQTVEVELARTNMLPSVAHNLIPDIQTTALARKTKEADIVPLMPIQGGRQSVPSDNVTLFEALRAEFATISPDYPIEFVKLIKLLAMYNADLSYAVNNIVQLGNTEYVIYFDDDTPEALQKEMSNFLTTRNKEIYRGGLYSFINDSLALAAITGAGSVEYVMNESLDDVMRIVMVDAETIKFVYDTPAADYKPYQMPVNMVGGQLIELNEVTYKYYALQRFGEKPYAIPPFLSAMESIEIERHMVQNMRNIVQRVGAFGFLSVLVTPPARLANEKDPEFLARNKNYLSQVYKETENGFNKGVVIGYKDTHDFKIQGSSNNVEGARELFNLISEMKMAGLKQDPLMLGRNFNVAETMARVILAKLSTMIVNYQKLVANMLEDLFMLRLRAQGYTVNEVTVEFKPPMISDRSKDAEAYGKEIDNAIKLRNENIIDQQDVAQAVGYDEAAGEAPPKPVLPDPNAKTDPKKPVTDTDTQVESTNSNSLALALAEVEATLGKFTREFPYTDGQRYRRFTSRLMWEFDDDMLDKAYRKYFDETNDNFEASVKASVQSIAKGLTKLETGVGTAQVVDSIMYELYKAWGKTFTPSQKKVVAKNIREAYSTFRNSDEYFKGLGIEVPKAVFNLNDVRAVNYYKDSDTHYLGKFITDEDMRKSITQYIKETYLENDMPIGDNKEALAKFASEFGDVLKLQQWKIAQILTTTVSNMRNTAAINYMAQAEVTQYKIVGIPDSKQSAFCKAINGKVFEVQTTLDTMQAVFSSDPAQVKTVQPFGTSLAKPDEVKNLDAAALQAMGIGIPPYHPFCRTRIIAVL